MRFCILLLFFSVLPSFADAAFLYQPQTQNEVMELQDVNAETVYGKLDGSPHTFTFAVSEETPFSMQLTLSPHQKINDVSMILVKQEKRGVSEIGRSNTKDKEQWNARYDFLRAVVLLWGKKYEYTLEPGIYTFEVSSPENNRGYRVVLGDGKTSPYKELRYVRSVFEVDKLSIVFSPLVFVPILVLVSIFFYLRKRSRKVYG